MALTALWQPVLTAAPPIAAALAELVPRSAVASLAQVSNLAADPFTAVSHLTAMAATAAPGVASVDYLASF